MNLFHQLPSFLLLGLRDLKHRLLIMFMSFQFLLLEPELTTSMVLKLSHRINSSVDIRLLAIDGLGLEEQVVKTHLYNERHDIRDAAYNVLDEWRKNQQSSRDAYRNLCAALKRVGMASYIESKESGIVDVNNRLPKMGNVVNWLPTLSKHSQMLGLMCIGACIGVCVHTYSHFFLKFHKQ